jgi:hypothetical protein
MDDFLQLTSQQDKMTGEVNSYIDGIINSAGGDKDFAVRQLTRDYEMALGTDNQARAQFLESVADEFEKKYGTIQKDYNTYTTYAREDLSTQEQRITGGRDRVLSRLSEDEKNWRENFAREAKEGKQSQAESLLERGILQGTREGAEGLAGGEVKRFDERLAQELDLFGRELGRTREDIGREAGENLFDVRRTTSRELERLKTLARRGAVGATRGERGCGAAAPAAHAFGAERERAESAREDRRRGQRGGGRGGGRRR